MHNNDRKNLAKAISGFGNSEGGVIVWGVDCSQDEEYADVAHTKFPLTKAKRFLSWLESTISGCTIPPHTMVQNHPIIINNKEDGFVVTYIPKSNNVPHQVVGEYRYYIRAGSSFVPTPHDVLAGMFGRRPNPYVYHKFKITPIEFTGDDLIIQIGILMHNGGVVIASNLYMMGLQISLPGDNCKLSYISSDFNIWASYRFGPQVGAISKIDFRLAPTAYTEPFGLQFKIGPPFSNKLEVDFICGCEGAPPIRFKIENESNKIEGIYNILLEKYSEDTLSEEEGYELVNKLLGISQDEVKQKTNTIGTNLQFY